MIFRKYPLIDSHIHIFNRRIFMGRTLDLMRFEVKEINQWLDLPPKDEEHDQKTNLADEKLRGWMKFLRIGLTKSPEEILTLLERKYRRSCVKISTVPLMFDIAFCYDDQPEDNNHEKRLKQQEKDQLEAFQQELDHLGDKVVKRLENNAENKLLRKGLNKLKQVHFDFSNLFDRWRESLEENDQEGFMEQIDQLQALKNKGFQIYPFLSVDPRRKTPKPIMAIFKEHFIDTPRQDWLFHGVKLYAPTGFSPTDPLLYQGNDCLYALCQKHQIPITTHCSTGGFASLSKDITITGYICEKEGNKRSIRHVDHETLHLETIRDKAYTLNHPLLWEKVLEKYPKLHLNMAHFNFNHDNEDDHKWYKTIKELVTMPANLDKASSDNNFEYKYPNAYTDISSLGLEDLDKTHQTISEDKALQKKVLLGTDYYMMLLFQPNFGHYLKKFLKAFSRQELKCYGLNNPQRFIPTLNIDKKAVPQQHDSLKPMT